MDTETEGGICGKLLESTVSKLKRRGLSKDGRFDPKNPKHWEALPDIFIGAYFCCKRWD